MAEVTPLALQRLHWSTPFITLPGRLARVALPAIVITAFSEPDGKPLGIVLVFFALYLIEPTLRWITLRYALEDDHLLLRTGLLFRRQRTIPYSRIQDIRQAQGPVHRLLGVAEVNVETAGGGGVEAQLSVISLAEAQRFRSELLQRRRPTEAPAGEVSEVVHKSRLPDLLLAGATENRVGIIVAGLFTLYETLDEAGGLLDRAVGWAESHVVPADESGQVVAAVAGVLALLLLGWLVSIVVTLFTWYGFVLRRTGTDLRLAHGLLTRVEALVPLRRLQVVRLESNLLRRLLGRAVLRAETAGSAKEKQSGGGLTLAPLLPQSAAHDLADVVLGEGSRLADTPLLPVHPLARRRGFIRLLPFVAAAVAAAVAWRGWQGALVAPLALILAWLLAAARYRALGWSLSPDTLLARAGVFTRRLWIVPLEKVQTVALHASPFQRRLGLASVYVNTAGSNGATLARVVDLARADAEALLEALSREAHARGNPRGGV